MNTQLISFLRHTLGSLRDLMPILLVVGFFQFAVLRQPLPDLGAVLIGLVAVLVGLTLFVQGLEMGLFPIGESLAFDFARKVLAEGQALDRVNVYEVMAKPVIAVDPEMDIRYCARLFDRFNLTRAPVVDRAGTVQGVVSFTDLVLNGLCRDI